MGQVTSLFVRKLVAQAGPDLDHGELLRSVGMAPQASVDPAEMISDTDYYALLERIVEHDPAVTDLGLRTGASMRADEYGALGLAFKSALNLRAFYERLARYARVLTTVATYEVREATEGVYVHHFRAGRRRLGLRISNEATMSALLAVGRQVAIAPVAVEEVFLSHPAPASTAAHTAFFGCPVHFDADRDALLFSHEAIETRNKLGDPSISQFFDAHLEAELAALNDDTSLEQRVRIQVSQLLSEGIPKVTDVARRLGTSGRTLQRRLAEQGHSYQGLVDEARRQLAERLLRETSYALAEVAFLTGFSEQSAFNRAFKRWAGQTPRSFRLKA